MLTEEKWSRHKELQAEMFWIGRQGEGFSFFFPCQIDVLFGKRAVAASGGGEIMVRVAAVAARTLRVLALRQAKAS